MSGTLYKKSVFIFRRDYRIQDNHAFAECFKKSSEILPLYIATPEQLTSLNQLVVLLYLTVKTLPNHDKRYIHNIKLVVRLEVV